MLCSWKHHDNFASTQTISCRRWQGLLLVRIRMCALLQYISCTPWDGGGCSYILNMVIQWKSTLVFYIVIPLACV